MMAGKVLHVYNRDGTIYYGNVMFRYVNPMTEEEYNDFIKDIIYKHFPYLRGRKYCMIWKEK